MTVDAAAVRTFLVAGLAGLLLAALAGPRDDFLDLARLLLAAAILLVLPLAGLLIEPGAGSAPRYFALARHRGWALAWWLAGVGLVLPPGPWSVVLVLGWVAWTGLLALAGLARWWSERPRAVPLLVETAALLYLPVAGVWLLADRLALRPLEFAPWIVLLTAVHFCYTGVAAPVVAAQAARLAAQGAAGWRRAANVAAVGIVVGTPLTALGITLQQVAGWRLPELVAVSVLAASLLLLAAVNGHLARHAVSDGMARRLLVGGAVCVVFGMAAAFAYAFRLLPGLGISQMVATHGLANATFVVLTVAAWLRMRLVQPTAERTAAP